MDESLKDQLLKALVESDKQNTAVMTRGQNLVDSSRLQLDLNAKLQAAVQSMSESSLPAPAWPRMTDAIRAQTAAADIADRQMREIEFIVVSGTNGATATVSSTAAAIRGTPTLEPNAATAVRVLEESLQAVFDGRDSAREVIELAGKLGLNVAHAGSRSPTDHLEQAALTLRRPPGLETSPTAVLMDVREGVDLLLDRMLKRLSAQKPCKNAAEKVALIGERAGHRVLGQGHFDRLGLDLQRLREDFADAKGAAMSRERVLNKFSETMFVLGEILKGIDPSRLK